LFEEPISKEEPNMVAKPLITELRSEEEPNMVAEVLVSEASYEVIDDNKPLVL
jgi:hypothetical protein